MSGPEIGLRWTAVTGASYQIESTNDLSIADWTAPTTATAIAQGSQAILTREKATFYRVRCFPDD